MDFRPHVLIIALFTSALGVIIAANVEGVAAIYGLDRMLPENWALLQMWASYLSGQAWFIWGFGFLTAPALYFLAGRPLRRLLNQSELARLIDREMRANALHFKHVGIFKLIPYDASPSTVHLHMLVKNIAPAPIYFVIEHASCSLQGKVNEQAELPDEAVFLPAGEERLINIPSIPDVTIREQMTGRLTVKFAFGFDRKHLTETLKIDGDIEIAIRRDNAGVV